MKRVTIESPLAGDFARNQRYARLCALDCKRRGEAAYASHLFFTQFLDDRDPEHRKFGIEAGYEWARTADIFVFYIDIGWSDGMRKAYDKWTAFCKYGPATIETRMLPVDLLALLDSDAPVHSTPGATE